MILIAASLAGLLTVPLTGGRLSRLAEVRFHRVWAVWASVGVQLLITVGPLDLRSEQAELLHVISYALAAWCIYANLQKPGVLLIGLGGALNALAIAENGGSMPATEWAWRTAGLQNPVGSLFQNSGVSSDSTLWFLGDVFAVPAGWPLANVFSVGDVLLVIGLLVLVNRACRSTPARKGRWQDRSHASFASRSVR